MWDRLTPENFAFIIASLLALLGIRVGFKSQPESVVEVAGALVDSKSVKEMSEAMEGLCARIEENSNLIRQQNALIRDSIELTDRAMRDMRELTFELERTRKT